MTTYSRGDRVEYWCNPGGIGGRWLPAVVLSAPAEGLVALRFDDPRRVVELVEVARLRPASDRADEPRVVTAGEG